MNVVTITAKNIMDEIDNYWDMFEEGDLLIAGFGTSDDFDYMSEFAGETQYLKKYVGFSGNKKIILIAATVSRLLGKYYNTAIVIDKGTILGVSDQTHKTHSELTLGGNLKLYETDCGNIGILIGEDIFFPECALSLCLSGADRLIYLANHEYGKDTDAMLKAASVFCGLNIVAVFLDFTIEYTNRGTRNIIEDEDLLIFESTVKRNNAYLKNRRESVYKTVVVHKNRQP